MRLIWSVVVLMSMFALSMQAQASEAPMNTEGAAYATGGEIVNVATGELGFMERYVPFKLPEKLHPKVEEEKVITWVGGVLFGGLGSWLISYLTLEQQPVENDALATGAIHSIGSWVALMTVLGSPLLCADHVYLAPVGVLSAWDRAYKGGGKRKSAQGLVAPPEMVMVY